MDEISTWFLDTYGYMGFELSPTIYCPYTFAPKRMVCYNNMVTRIFIEPSIITDTSLSYYEALQMYKDILTDMINEYLEPLCEPLKPKKIIKRKIRFD